MLGLENPEEILLILDRFNAQKLKDIPKELDEYIAYVARTGDPVYGWPTIQNLFREKLTAVIKDFHDTTPSIEDLPPCPNVDPFNYEMLKTTLLERIDMFSAAPFTVQRLCELMINPKKHYGRLDKFLRALEKTILVVSTIEPGRNKPDSENGDSLSLDTSLDSDMEASTNGAPDAVGPPENAADKVDDKDEQQPEAPSVAVANGTNGDSADDGKPAAENAEPTMEDDAAGPEAQTATDSNGTEEDGKPLTTNAESVAIEEDKAAAPVADGNEVDVKVAGVPVEVTVKDAEMQVDEADDATVDEPSKSDDEQKAGETAAPAEKMDDEVVAEQPAQKTEDETSVASSSDAKPIGDVQKAEVEVPLVAALSAGKHSRSDDEDNDIEASSSKMARIDDGLDEAAAKPTAVDSVQTSECSSTTVEAKAGASDVAESEAKPIVEEPGSTGDSDPEPATAKRPTVEIVEVSEAESVGIPGDETLVGQSAPIVSEPDSSSTSVAAAETSADALNIEAVLVDGAPAEKAEDKPVEAIVGEEAESTAGKDEATAESLDEAIETAAELKAATAESSEAEPSEAEQKPTGEADVAVAEPDKQTADEVAEPEKMNVVEASSPIDDIVTAEAVMEDSPTAEAATDEAAVASAEAAVTEMDASPIVEAGGDGIEEPTKVPEKLEVDSSVGKQDDDAVAGGGDGDKMDIDDAGVVAESMEL